MDKNTRLGLDFYLEQQCIFAGFAFDDLTAEIGVGYNTHNADRMWYSVHGFLTAIANISKTFDPPRGDPNRGVQLRADYAIDSQNPFMDRNMKEIRNAMEHHDERFEKWAGEHPGQGFSAFSLKVGQIPVTSNDSDHFTLFIPSLTITYLGWMVRIKPLYEEAKQLVPKIQAHYRRLMSPSHPDKVIPGVQEEERDERREV